MIVCDLGGSWQCIEQVDHAELAARLAARSDDRGSRHDAFLHAVLRHDDGWTVQDVRPALDRATGGPVDFRAAPVAAAVQGFRAAVAAVEAEDEYAALLVSMHAAGIFQGYYGIRPGPVREVPEADRAFVDAFVAEQEEAYGDRVAATGVGDGEHWNDYRLLQRYDVMSLLACGADVHGGPPLEVAGVRVAAMGERTFALDPFPFPGERVEEEVRRRVLEPAAWAGHGELRRALAEAPYETALVTLTASPR